jgi:hypothetical protein
MTTEQLSLPEQADLATHESQIERGLQTFYEVGAALLAIRDQRLYRAAHATFEAYCRERWGMVASRARQLIQAAQVVASIESVTNVTPTNEAQARPLAAVAPEDRAEVWREAVETAPNGKVTAAHVQRVVDQRTPEPPLPFEPEPIDDEDTNDPAEAFAALGYNADAPDDEADEPLSAYESAVQAATSPINPAFSLNHWSARASAIGAKLLGYGPDWALHEPSGTVSRYNNGDEEMLTRRIVALERAAGIEPATPPIAPRVARAPTVEPTPEPFEAVFVELSDEDGVTVSVRANGLERHESEAIAQIAEALRLLGLGQAHAIDTALLDELAERCGGLIGGFITQILDESEVGV